MPIKKAKTKSTKSVTSRKKLALTFTAIREQLRTFFNDADEEEREKLWSVLSALRGPDCPGVDANDIKVATTALIRATFLGTDSAQRAFLVWTGTDKGFRANQRIALTQKVLDNPHALPGGHFHNHARQAFDVLGLKWSETNII